MQCRGLNAADGVRAVQRPRAGFVRAHERSFESIISHKGYYLLRKLPKPVAKKLLLPVLPDLLSKQRKTGLWSNSERITYDILTAIQTADVGDIGEILKQQHIAAIETSEGFYAVLIKKDIFGTLQERDRAAIGEMIAKEKGEQKENGSWEDTVVGTALHLETLLDLDVNPEDEAIRRGVAFLFANWNEALQGIHTKNTYDLVGHAMFTTPDRRREFEAAERLKPEWLPREVCFRTLAVLPNAVCLILLIRLGLEEDERVVRALDNVYHLFSTYGGLCATNIKKPFL